MDIIVNLLDSAKEKILKTWRVGEKREQRAGGQLDTSVA